ncbi:MAG: hypothetical protein WBD36_04740 [Bacteroidota bacterium]
MPRDLLVSGQVNTLAVRVLDVYMHGGIHDGPVGLIAKKTFREWRKANERRRSIFDWFQ